MCENWGWQNCPYVLSAAQAGRIFCTQFFDWQLCREGGDHTLYNVTRMPLSNTKNFTCLMRWEVHSKMSSHHHQHRHSVAARAAAACAIWWKMYGSGIDWQQYALSFVSAVAIKQLIERQWQKQIFYSSHTHVRWMLFIWIICRICRFHSHTRMWWRFLLVWPGDLFTRKMSIEYI